MSLMSIHWAGVELQLLGTSLTQFKPKLRCLSSGQCWALKYLAWLCLFAVQRTEVRLTQACWQFLENYVQIALNSQNRTTMGLVQDIFDNGCDAGASKPKAIYDQIYTKSKFFLLHQNDGVMESKQRIFETFEPKSVFFFSIQHQAKECLSQ
jgi:hypothetical protein